MAVLMAVLKKLGYTLLILISISLGGCSLFNPKVTIAPQVAVAETDSIVLDGPVTVSIYDERLQTSLGKQRVFFFGDRPLGITNNLPDSVKSAIEQALYSAGMKPGHSSESPQLQIYIDKLIYEIPEGSMTDKVDARASIRVVLQTPSKTYRRSFDAQKVSDKGDKQLANEVLEQAINKALTDPQFIRQLGAL